MNEFSSRVDAQRRIVKVVNRENWKSEQLFALSSSAIQRWASANGMDFSSPLAKLLFGASAEIFAMANNSDDPISGTYLITKRRVGVIEEQVEREVAIIIHSHASESS